MKENTDIQLQQQGDITIMNIRGDITSYSASIFKETYQQALTQGHPKKNRPDGLKIDRKILIMN